MKELEKKSGFRIIAGENGNTVGFYIDNPAFMPRDVLTEIIRYQLEGVQPRLITIYCGKERIIIEQDDLNRLRQSYKKARLQEPTVYRLVNRVTSSRGFLVMDPDPTSS